MIALAAPGRAALVALTAVTVLLTAGCPEQAAQVDPVPEKEPTPEERFTRLVEEIRNRIEDDSVGTAAAVADINAGPGVPVTIGKFRVDSEFVPPASEGDPYRGKVYLFSRSKVTVSMPAAEEGEESTPGGPADDDLNLEIEGLPDLEQLRVPQRTNGATQLGSSPLHEIAPGETRTEVEFEFKDGRWVPITELDSQAQPFYALAIEQALSLQ